MPEKQPEKQEIPAPEQVNEPVLDAADVEYRKGLQERADTEREKENRSGQEIRELKENIEASLEKLPTKQEIFDLLGEDMKTCVVGQEKSDEKGLYRLDFKAEDETEYDYMRAGKFDGHESEETYICKTTPTTWPEKVYLYQNYTWKKCN
jgi:hypothetical protein